MNLAAAVGLVQVWAGGRGNLSRSVNRAASSPIVLSEALPSLGLLLNGNSLSSANPVQRRHPFLLERPASPHNNKDNSSSNVILWKNLLRPPLISWASMLDLPQLHLHLETCTMPIPCPRGQHLYRPPLAPSRGNRAPKS